MTSTTSSPNAPPPADDSPVRAAPPPEAATAVAKALAILAGLTLISLAAFALMLGFIHGPSGVRALSPAHSHAAAAFLATLALAPGAAWAGTPRRARAWLAICLACSLAAAWVLS